MPKLKGFQGEAVAMGEQMEGSMSALKEKQEIKELEDFAEKLDGMMAELTAELKEFWATEECTTKHGVEEPKWFESAAKI